MKKMNGCVVKNGVIELTKAFAKNAYTPGTAEFRYLTELHKSFPDFSIVQRTATPNKEKEKHGGLTIARMEFIIKNYVGDEIALAEFVEVKKFYKGLNGYYGKVKRLFDVSPSNFLPAPSVTSTVIRIELYDKNPYFVKDEGLLFDVIAGAFAQRRKTLLNSLSSSVSYIPKSRIGEIITECGFDINIRGERLSVNDFCTLANAIFDEKSKKQSNSSFLLKGIIK